MGDRLGIDALRIDPADPLLTSKVRKPKWERKFVQFPWTWAERLKSVNRGSTYRLALLLLYGNWRNGGQPIKVSNVMLAGDGLTRRSKGRALHELERLGLIRVERHARKSPVVTVIVAFKS